MPYWRENMLLPKADFFSGIVKIYVIGGAIGKFRDVNWNDPEWKGLSTIEEYTPDN
jgi:hypothetical protein